MGIFILSGIIISKHSLGAKKAKESSFRHVCGRNPGPRILSVYITPLSLGEKKAAERNTSEIEIYLQKMEFGFRISLSLYLRFVNRK